MLLLAAVANTKRIVISEKPRVECDEHIIKVATREENECKRRVDEREKLFATQTFRCNNPRRDSTKYFECGRIFNQITTDFNPKCVGPRYWSIKRVFHVTRQYFRPTYECSLGLSGWWNANKFGLDKKARTPAEAAEERVMNATNTCLAIIANRNNRKMRKLTKDNNGNLPFSPKPSIEYTLCVQKLLMSVFEEDEKLGQAVKFYPNYPNNIEQEYSAPADNQQNKELVRNSLSDLEKGCQTFASSKSSEKCEQAKIYNRCVGRISEASMLWSKIDRSILSVFRTRDEAKECETASGDNTD